MYLRDTIVAISTPPGHSGLGVVRLSGPEATTCAEKFLRFRSNHVWQGQRAQLATLVDNAGSVIDQVMALFFQSPHSYTCEDVVEISCHGAPVVLQFCLERAVAAGARIAEPGEFTLRAYLHGRIDLPQAEAVRELIDATTLYQARVATQQIEGSVSRRIRSAKEKLVELISLLEAGIDFAEDDVSVAPDREILRRLSEVQTSLQELSDTFGSGQLIFGGFSLAIAGRPNVGKSSLFNCLLERDRAIVTEIPGTTRDTISESASLRGLPVKFIDTAGMRSSDDYIEKLGIERSFEAVADADLTLLVLDRSAELTDEDRSVLQRFEERRPLMVGNKSDLGPARWNAPESIPVSALTGEGLEVLREAILQRLAPSGLVSPESGAITNTRHAALLRESLEALANARRAVEYKIPHEMLLLDLYAALRPVDAITGATTADDILNRIFSTFCIGK